jgi:hypothetical protein
VGAIVVGLSICFVCKRKKRHIEKQTPCEKPNPLANHFETMETPPHDFVTMEIPTPAILVDNHSPMMQQHQLQIKLQQQLYIPNHHNSFLPPPPYHP